MNNVNPSPNNVASAHLNRRLILVTGASRGLGKNGALKLAEAGFDLVLTYQSNQAQAQAVAAAAQSLGSTAIILPLDMSQPAALADFVTQLHTQLHQTWPGRKLDGVIHNAGIGIHQAFQETTMAQFDELMNIHVKGPYFLTQQLLPLLNDGGTLLMLSTGLTRFAIPGYSAYAMMKGAIETMTRYLAKELAPRKIRVNTLAPGAIETDFGGGAVRDVPEINQFISANTALGRVGQPDDIGAVMRLLFSADAGWLNAQRIEASGGMFL